MDRRIIVQHLVFSVVWSVTQRSVRYIYPETTFHELLMLNFAMTVLLSILYIFKVYNSI